MFLTSYKGPTLKLHVMEEGEEEERGGGGGGGTGFLFSSKHKLWNIHRYWLVQEFAESLQRGLH